jgi:REP element-mobilizing transposase RayT
MPQSFDALYVHLVFSTKSRERWTTAELRERLFPYMTSILDNHGVSLLAVGGVEDHVHLLLSLGRNHTVAEAARLVKCNSSKWIHETFGDLSHFSWQTGYGAFSVSHSQVQAVRRYIENQEEHHKTLSFQEEFLLFLKRHNISYSEEYLWD